jgi:hypothetical protein
MIASRSKAMLLRPAEERSMATCETTSDTYWLTWVLEAVMNGQYIDDETVTRARAELAALVAGQAEGGSR